MSTTYYLLNAIDAVLDMEISPELFTDAVIANIRISLDDYGPFRFD